MPTDYIGDCSICNRPMLKNKFIDEHHLIPKCKNGTYGEKVTIHRVCHEKIHSIWSESELASYYHTPDRILEHPEIQKFVKWLKRKPADFHTKTKMSNRRKR